VALEEFKLTLKILDGGVTEEDSESRRLGHIALAFPCPTMTVTTRRSNADVHPGRIVLDSQQARRTKKQVQEAKARAKAVKDQEEARRLALPGHIAQLEDGIETEEQTRYKHSMRPDLRLCSTQPTDRILPG
jgi:hypothetical protein